MAFWDNIDFFQYQQMFSDWLSSNVPKIVGTIAILIIGWIIIKIIVKAIKRIFDKTNFERTIEVFIERSIGVVLWIILLLVVLSNLGIDVGALVAGLGIMGFIVGFALKDTLGNLASGLFLLFHKPFRLNDYVEAGGVSGIVEAIAVAACTLRTPDNKKITIPNSIIWGQPITNYTGRKERRIEIIVGISYSSNMDKAIKTVHEILKKNKLVLKEPEPQVVIAELADSSVNMKIRPWVKTSDYWDVYFGLTKKIKQEFDKKKIEIPFPQMDLHMKKK